MCICVHGYAQGVPYSLPDQSMRVKTADRVVLRDSLYACTNVFTYLKNQLDKPLITLIGYKITESKSII